MAIPIPHARLYDETYRLLIEARDYLEREAGREAEHYAPMGKLIVSRELTRLTSRMTALMAWCLMRRAVHAGEVSGPEAARMGRLAGRAACLKPSPFDGPIYPPRLRDLLDRSHALYARVSRLDAMLSSSPDDNQDEAGGGRRP